MNENFKSSGCAIAKSTDRFRNCYWQDYYLKRGFVMARTENEHLRWTKPNKLRKDEEVYHTSVDYILHGMCPVGIHLSAKSQKNMGNVETITLENVDLNMLNRQYLALIQKLSDSNSSKSILWGLVELLGDFFESRKDEYPKTRPDPTDPYEIIEQKYCQSCIDNKTYNDGKICKKCRVWKCNGLMDERYENICKDCTK